MYTAQNVVLYGTLAYVGWHYLWKYLVRLSTGKETAVYDLQRFEKICKDASNTSEKGVKKHDKCVIVGGGVAGCITGAIMTRHFKEVIIVEQAETIANFRERTMQYDQLHVFGPIVAETLQVVWPQAFYNAVIKRGGRFATSKDQSFDMYFGKYRIYWNETLGYFGSSGNDSLMLSRPQMQQALFDLAKNHTPGLKFIHGKVEGAMYSKDGKNIEMITVKKSSDGVTQNVSCDLLLDCSGPSRVYKKLITGKTQFEAPQLDKYQTHMAYSTATVNVHESIAKRLPLPPHVLPKGITWNEAGIVFMVSCMLTGHHTNLLMAHTDNNNYYLCTSALNTKPSDMSSTLETFREASKQIYTENTGNEMDPWFDETIDLLLENEEITGEKVKFYLARDQDSYTSEIKPTNRKLPSNLALVGDSYCKLNPTYGQGTQKAVTEALTLSTALDKSSEIGDAVKTFEKDRKPKTFGLFDFNRALDLASTEVQSINSDLAKKQVGKENRALMSSLLKYMAKYDDVGKMTALAQIIMGVKGSMALMHPSMLFAVIWGSFI